MNPTPASIEMTAREPQLSNRWLKVLVVAGVACVGIERIDVLGGSGPLALTPALIVSCLLIGTCLVLVIRRRIAFRWRLATALLLGFMGVALAGSALNGMAVLSLGRSALLAISILGGWALITLAVVMRRYDLLRWGAAAGLALFALFALLQVALWVSVGPPGLGRVGPIDLGLMQLGAELPRITGTTIDPNRACLTVTFFVTLLLARFPSLRPLPAAQQLIVAGLATALVIATWSRSGLLLYVIVVGGIWVLPALARLPRRTRWWVVSSVAVVGVSALLVTYLVASDTIEYLVRTRLLVAQGDSASEHITLWSIAFAAIAASPIILLTGIGYGRSYLLLENVGSMAGAGDHANFHSIYTTGLIELGIVGLVLLLAILALPIRSRWAPISIGLLTFGIFYQAMNDMSQWALLAVAWTVGETIRTSDQRSSLFLRGRKQAGSERIPVSDHADD